VRSTSGRRGAGLLKNGDEVPDDAVVRLLDDAEARYVSRGGLKLEGASTAVGLVGAGLATVWMWASRPADLPTACCSSGAASVVGVDVGTAQLHPQLRSDPRVLRVEGVNARALNSSDDLPGRAQAAPNSCLLST